MTDRVEHITDPGFNRRVDNPARGLLASGKIQKYTLREQGLALLQRSGAEVV